ncbi:MAG: ATP-binding cassette domain-containing protein [Salaquimonas sp.]
MTQEAFATTDLRLEKVSISLGGKKLLELDEVVKPGEVLSVMGPSGSGKSSLLAFIAGFLDPAFKAEGRVCLGDKSITDLPPEERSVGLLFQDALLFPHMSVAQNLAFAIPKSVASKAKRNQLVLEALALTELDGMAERDPATLSGGQKSRIALMRVLLAKPRALLLDEPFSKLDAELRNQIRQFVFTEAGKRNLPVLLVTHDEQDVSAAKGKIIKLEH